MPSLKQVYAGAKFDERWMESRSFSKSLKMEAYDSSTPSSSPPYFSANSKQVREENFGIKQNIRNIFGKQGRTSDLIGGHPDFSHLIHADTQEYGYTVSLFLDIKGSTRLGLIYKPEEVFFIKNTIIKCAIETIQAFDGHVHRIMGDAVLAFFRGNSVSARNAAIDAINCGTYLVEFMKQIVLPTLQEADVYEDIGIRIGIDYGSTNSVLWGVYGYPGASEVTATSFHVDVAAKLQQKAPRNRVMIGQALKDLLDLHDDVIESRYTIKNSEKKIVKYITPNYKDGLGNRINYEQYVITHRSYFDLLPKPEDVGKKIRISSSLSPTKDTPSSDDYIQCSRCVTKPNGIRFKAMFHLPPGSSPAELAVIFRVKNHGTDASKIVTPPYGNHQTAVQPVRRADTSYFAHHWEGSSYIGLHYMYISVLGDGRVLIPEEKFAVYIGD